MNDPLSGISSSHPEKTLLLGQVFNDTAASYKFFWFLGLLNLLQRNGNAVMTQREIIEEMIVRAWHPVCFYRLSLGTQDKLQEAVKELQTEAGLQNDAKADEIRAQIGATVSMQRWLRNLSTLVPTRFLSPWFSAELRGIDGHDRTRRIQELAAKSQNSAAPSPYHFERMGDETLIRVNQSWAAFSERILR